MKKSLLLVACTAMMIGLAGCGQTASSSAVASSAASSSAASTAVASVATSSAVVSSSEAPSSSEASSVASSSEVVSSAASSAVALADVDIDIAKIETSKTPNALKNTNYDGTDGFFTCTGVQIDVSSNPNVVKSGGSSVVSTMNHVIAFTTTAASKLYIRSKSGTSNADRALYVAKAGEGSAYTIVARQLDNVFDGTTATWIEDIFEMPDAGKYYILTTDGVSISKLSVWYSGIPAEFKFVDTTKTTIAVSENNNMTEKVGSADKFYPYELIPTGLAISGAKTVGNFTINSTASYIDFGGARYLDAKANANYRNTFLHLAKDETISYTAATAGTLTIYAMGNTEDGTATTAVNVKDSTDAQVGTGNAASYNLSTKIVNPVSVAISGAGTYKISAADDCFIFQSSFAAI